MGLDQKTASEIARRYFRNSNPPVRLGWGISGYVFLSPDLRTAVKIHRSRESFIRELEVYRLLHRLKISRLHGLTIPKLIKYRSRIKLIQMDFVSAPYLLDFAGASLTPPDFPDDAMQLWHGGIDEVFGPNASVVYAIYNSLVQHGIYYMDFRPSNLKLDGLPGLILP
jgi:hypothetical protein